LVELGAADVVTGELAGVVVFAVPTVTSGVIFVSCDALRFNFFKSSTLEYGRPAIIFFAVASPIPGSASSCAWVAVLRSTGPVGAAVFVLVDAAIAGNTIAAKSSIKATTRIAILTDFM